MKKYCKYCGDKLKSDESGFYNEETGEKETCLVCVNPKCDLSIKKCKNCQNVLTNKNWLLPVCEKCFYNFK